ncbi:hypothetical protein [Mycolicibacter hiberniae]|uniref:Transmembrane protein n=1 Tax=Mycolicibacter hiberniae TaxID=29314 RepID=A0A7I7X8H9_9MYCO|nr:hypothetical protein [Mycolicibacter hiberniae]MCV7087241.1 hypothetical protein [Mycolicibacter hiberniae]BBZ25545.1 hypothetical protein MHIB_39630 [Mycolicibacter hiberniae]
MSDHDVASVGPNADGPGPLSPAPLVRFDFQPYHVLRVLAGAWAVAGLVTWPGIGCWVSAAVSAWADWYTRKNRIGWPIDVEDFLVERGWALRRPRHRAADNRPLIPFRPMTVPELYAAAVKILLRNWPTLVGVPAVICTGFGAVFVMIMHSLEAPTPAHVAQLLFSGHDTMLSVSSMTLAVLVVLYALVLPADALLILLGVQATDKVIGGKRVRFEEMLCSATERVCTVCRLTFAYYMIGVVALLLHVVARYSGFYAATIPLLVVASVAAFVLARLLSMSPIVLIRENRGVAESFRRSIELCKPAAGRIIGIYVLWMAGMVAVALLSSALTWVTVVITYPVLIGLVRCLQMLVYTDLRIRQENYAPELFAEWMRNMGREGLASG